MNCNMDCQYCVRRVGLLTYLNNTVITVAHSHVVIDVQALQMLDQTTLQITGTTRLDRSINQTLIFKNYYNIQQ